MKMSRVENNMIYVQIYEKKLHLLEVKKNQKNYKKGYKIYFICHTSFKSVAGYLVTSIFVTRSLKQNQGRLSLCLILL